VRVSAACDSKSDAVMQRVSIDHRGARGERSTLPLACDRSVAANVNRGPGRRELDQRDLVPARDLPPGLAAHRRRAAVLASNPREDLDLAVSPDHKDGCEVLKEGGMQAPLAGANAAVVRAVRLSPVKA
jgi:hypothetical protein